MAVARRSSKSKVEPAAPMTLQVTRAFKASPEQVFDAWLNPDSVGRWLFATPGGEMQEVALDPRPGGAFTIVELRGEQRAEHFGEFLEIVRPRRLVFTFGTSKEEAPSLVTVEIAPTSEGCHLTLTHEMDAKWQAYRERVQDGWASILAGLEEKGIH